MPLVENTGPKFDRCSELAATMTVISTDAPDRKQIMNHDAVVVDWRQNAATCDEANYDFLRSMKCRDYGFEPDELAAELHDQAFQIIDCTRCANCCNTMDIPVDEEDIKRIAESLDMAVEDFVQTYLEADDRRESYKVRGKPCAFLGEDGHCTIYDVRPTVCREYPHTDKEGIYFQNDQCCEQRTELPRRLLDRRGDEAAKAAIRDDWGSGFGRDFERGIAATSRSWIGSVGQEVTS